MLPVVAQPSQATSVTTTSSGGTPNAGYFIDSVDGSDSNPGTSPSLPFKSLAALNGKRLTRISIACGSVLIADGFSPNNGGVTFTTYGTGPKPILHNAVPQSSGSWTQLSGTIYSMPTSSTYNGSSIWWDASAGAGTEGQVTHLIKGAAGALTSNQWAISGGNLQVNIGRAPTATDVMQVPQNTNQLVTVEGKNNIRFENYSFRFAGTDGLQAATASAVDDLCAYRCEFAYLGGGAFHVGTGAAATNIVADSCYFHDQYNQQNAFSMHCDAAAGSGAVINCTFRRIAGWGITCADTATLLRYNCVLDGARMFLVGNGAGSPGIHNWIKIRQYNQCPEATAGVSFIQIDRTAACQPGTIINLYNCSLAAGDMPIEQRGLDHGSGTLTIKNFAFYGCFGIALRGDNVNGSRTTQCIAGSIFGRELFNWYVAGSSGNLNGPGDVSYGVNTPYTDVSTGDLTLIVGSPGSLLHGAGTAITDVTNSATPDIGYTGAT